MRSDIKDLNTNLGIFRGTYCLAMAACLQHRTPIPYNYTSNSELFRFFTLSCNLLKGLHFYFVMLSQYFVTTVKYK